MKGIVLDVKGGYFIKVEFCTLSTTRDVEFVFTRQAVSLGRGAGQFYDGKATDQRLATAVLRHMMTEEAMLYFAPFCCRRR